MKAEGEVCAVTGGSSTAAMRSSPMAGVREEFSGRGRHVARRGLGLAGPAEDKAEPPVVKTREMGVAVAAGRTGLTSIGTGAVVLGGAVAAESEESSPPPPPPLR